ncbi:MAG: hypothetical protein ABIQ99_02855 [Thermoflexales bacterium]
MNHRVTYSLDERTRDRIAKLAEHWHVSQAEVVRRSIAEAEAAVARERPDPVALLEALHAQGLGLDPKIAKAYADEVRADRKRWRTR